MKKGRGKEKYAVREEERFRREGWGRERKGRERKGRKEKMNKGDKGGIERSKERREGKN